MDNICTELPLHRPAIHGMKRKYRIGDILRGNCTSDGSKPAANLTWYINDRQVRISGYTIHLPYSIYLNHCRKIAKTITELLFNNSHCTLPA